MVLKREFNTPDEEMKKIVLKVSVGVSVSVRQGRKSGREMGLRDICLRGPLCYNSFGQWIVLKMGRMGQQGKVGWGKKVT